jgi:hypothetical protein
VAVGGLGQFGFSFYFELQGLAAIIGPVGWSFIVGYYK